jgi:hypothetical protein
VGGVAGLGWEGAGERETPLAPLPRRAGDAAARDELGAVGFGDEPRRGIARVKFWGILNLFYT